MAYREPSDNYDFYDPYYNDDPSSEQYENGVQLGKNLEMIQGHMCDLLKMLYGKEKLNLEALDDTMDQLCAYLDVKMPAGLPTIQRYGAEQMLHDVTKDMLKQAGIEI